MLMCLRSCTIRQQYEHWFPQSVVSERSGVVVCRATSSSRAEQVKSRPEPDMSINAALAPYFRPPSAGRAPLAHPPPLAIDLHADRIIPHGRLTIRPSSRTCSAGRRLQQAMHRGPWHEAPRTDGYVAPALLRPSQAAHRTRRFFSTLPRRCVQLVSSIVRAVHSPTGTLTLPEC